MKTDWSELVGKRVLVRWVRSWRSSSPTEVHVVEVSPAGRVKLRYASRNDWTWAEADEYELLEVLKESGTVGGYRLEIR